MSTKKQVKIFLPEKVYNFYSDESTKRGSPLSTTLALVLSNIYFDKLNPFQLGSVQKTSLTNTKSKPVRPANIRKNLHGKFIVPVDRTPERFAKYNLRVPTRTSSSSLEKVSHNMWVSLPPKCRAVVEYGVRSAFMAVEDNGVPWIEHIDRPTPRLFARGLWYALREALPALVGENHQSSVALETLANEQPEVIADALSHLLSDVDVKPDTIIDPDETNQTFFSVIVVMARDGDLMDYIKLDDSVESGDDD